MFSQEEHLNNLVRHIDLVRNAGVLLGRRLMARGQVEFGRILIGNVYVHDASKFSGIEWDYLHSGNDVPKDKLAMAIKQHVHTNSHHPEYWGGFEHMPDIAIAELVADWSARSTEFGNGIRDWIKGTAIDKFRIDTESREYERLEYYLDILLEDSFVRS